MAAQPPIMNPPVMNNAVDASARKSPDGGGQPFEPPEEVLANWIGAPSGVRGTSSAVAPSPLTQVTPLEDQAAIDPQQFRKALAENEARQLRHRQRDIQERFSLIFILCACAFIITALIVLAMTVFDMDEPSPPTDYELVPTTLSRNDSQESIDGHLREAMDEVAEKGPGTSIALVDRAYTKSAVLPRHFFDGEIA